MPERNIYCLRCFPDGTIDPLASTIRGGCIVHRLDIVDGVAVDACRTAGAEQPNPPTTVESDDDAIAFLEALAWVQRLGVVCGPLSPPSDEDRHLFTNSAGVVDEDEEAWRDYCEYATEAQCARDYERSVARLATYERAINALRAKVVVS